MSAQARAIFHDIIVAYVLREKIRFFPRVTKKILRAFKKEKNYG